MKNHLFILFIFFILFFVSCKIFNSEKIILTEPINSYNYVNMDSSFDMRILAYFPAPIDCGTRAFASCTVGITQNRDTIRVLSLCNRDTTFKENDIVKVIPEQKPDFNVSLFIFVRQIDKKHWDLCNWQTKDIKTMYGKLMKNLR